MQKGRNMIQDIAPKSLNNQYDPAKKPCASSPVFHFQGKKLLCSVRQDRGPVQVCVSGPSSVSLTREISFPTYEQAAAAGAFKGGEPSVNGPVPDLSFIFSVGDDDCFLLRNGDALEIPGFTYEEIGVYRDAFPVENAYAAVTAFHLNNWYESERFCGHCGTPLVHDGVERMMRCPKCGNMIFPRINPCVIVGIMHEDKILCTQYNRPGSGRFALVAGFCEIGETIEDTVRREVMEEVGIRVKNITFYKSQPWAMSSSLLCGFLCEAESEDAHADGVELASARWFTRDELRECYTPSHVALTSNIITAFMNGEIGPENCRR